MGEQIRLHIDETLTQIVRLETVLDTSASGLKDAALSMSWSMAAVMHSFASDEIITLVGSTTARMTLN